MNADELHAAVKGELCKLKHCIGKSGVPDKMQLIKEVERLICLHEILKGLRIPGGDGRAYVLPDPWARDACYDARYRILWDNGSEDRNHWTSITDAQIPRYLYPGSIVIP